MQAQRSAPAASRRGGLVPSATAAVIVCRLQLRGAALGVGAALRGAATTRDVAASRLVERHACMVLPSTTRNFTEGRGGRQRQALVLVLACTAPLVPHRVFFFFAACAHNSHRGGLWRANSSLPTRSTADESAGPAFCSLCLGLGPALRGRAGPGVRPVPGARGVPEREMGSRAQLDQPMPHEMLTDSCTPPPASRAPGPRPSRARWPAQPPRPSPQRQRAAAPACSIAPAGSAASARAPGWHRRTPRCGRRPFQAGDVAGDPFYVRSVGPGRRAA